MANKLPVFKLYPGEFGLLLIVLATSAYMFYGSYAYQGLMGFFPRLMAAIVFSLALLLILRRVFPDQIQNKIESEAEGFAETVQEIEGDEEDTIDELDEPERNSTTRKTNVLGLLTGAYMLGGFLFGLLWVSPLYVIAWHRYTGYEWRTSLGIAGAVMLVVYLMMDIFNFTLETGYFFTDIVGIDIPLTILPEIPLQLVQHGVI